MYNIFGVDQLLNSQPYGVTRSVFVINWLEEYIKMWKQAVSKKNPKNSCRKKKKKSTTSQPTRTCYNVGQKHLWYVHTKHVRPGTYNLVYGDIHGISYKKLLALLDRGEGLFLEKKKWKLAHKQEIQCFTPLSISTRVHEGDR